MKRSPDQIRVLLLQIRETQSIARHEFDCVVGRCGFHPDRVRAVNIAEQPVPAWAEAEVADIVMIGGAGLYSATENHPFSHPLHELVLRIVEAGKPMVGLCWGHQFIAKALGGMVVTDLDKGEAGTHLVSLTDAGRLDPLFAHSPETFQVHMGHNDYVSQLPPGAVELAASDRCRNQAFRIAGKPIYGTQFHIELNAWQLIERLSIYREIYTANEAHFEDIRSNPIPTPESDALLSRFLDLYVL